MKRLVILISFIICFSFVSDVFGSDIASLIKDLGDKKKAKGVSYELAQIGKPAVPELIKALESHNKYQKRYAARAIREMGQIGSDAIPAMEKLLKDWDTQTREYAVEALGNMVQQVDKVMPILKKARKDSDKGVRKKAKKAIEKLRSKLVEPIKNSEEGKSANEKLDTTLVDIEKNIEEAKKEIETASSYTDEKAYITRSETIPSGCIELQEGPYGVPLDATLSEVIEWSKNQGLVTYDMETEEYYKQQITIAVDEIEELRKDGFCGWVPKEGKLSLEIKLSMEESRFALDHKCSNLAFASSMDGGRERIYALRIRNFLNTLNNPYYIDEKGKHPLVPVFWLSSCPLGRKVTGVGIELFNNGDVVYKGDDRIIRNTCQLNLSMPHILNQDEPLSKINVFFVRTTDGQWKSYAVLSYFVADTETHAKILNTLNEKYGHYVWVKPGECIAGHPRPSDSSGSVCDLIIPKGPGFDIVPSPEAAKFQSKLKHLAGLDFSELAAPGELPDFLVWRANIFAYGGYSEMDFTVRVPEYRDFSLSRAHSFALFYYDAKYIEEIIKTHITAAKAAIKEYYEKQEQQDKRLKEKF